MRSFFYVLMLILLMPAASLAKTYYVATDGNDNNSGTQDNPFSTLSKATVTAMEGDSIVIRAGVYSQSGIVFPHSGSGPGKYIVITSYPGEEVIIDGANTQYPNGFIIAGMSYIKIEKLKLRNFSDNAIWIENSNNFEITDCEVYQSTGGIGITDGSHDFKLTRVIMHDFLLYGFDASPVGDLPCYNGVLDNCIAHTGSDPEQNVDGFALGHGSQSGFVLNKCVTYGVFDGFDISAQSTILNSCLAYDCSNGGYKLWQKDIHLINCVAYQNTLTNVELDWQGSLNSKHVYLQNCTFFDAGTFNVWIENAADTLEMNNCILAGGDNIGLAFEQNGNVYIGDHNIFHNDNTERLITVAFEDEFSADDVKNGLWINYSNNDRNSLVVDNVEDLFKNAMDGDFHLKSGSSAIDNGSPDNAPAEDFDGSQRPFGNGHDIGAFEWISGSGVDGYPDSGRFYLGIYPNPAVSNVIFNVKSSACCEADIYIYTLEGKIANVISFRTSGTEEIIEWPGIDKEGNKLPPGVYLAVLIADGRRCRTSAFIVSP